eukprot:m.70632 g.70632  ORF g.70632 m.70632 type:complete len:364 (-) comp14080_c0_seq2:50-1141(-)
MGTQRARRRHTAAERATRTNSATELSTAASGGGQPLAFSTGGATLALVAALCSAAWLLFPFPLPPPPPPPPVTSSSRNNAPLHPSQLPLQTDDPPLPNRTLLCGRCGVWRMDKFLSDAEVDHLLALVAAHGGWAPSASGGATFAEVRQLRSTFPHAMRHDPVLAAIERRVAALTGIPVHPHEDMVSLANITSRGSQPRNGHFPPFGLHHESDGRPFRARTVLMYLTTVPRGGHTIFPLCGKLRPELKPLRESLQEGLLAQWGGPESHYQRHVAFDIASEHPFMDLISASCQGKFGVSVPPVRGSAILFDSMLPTREPNPLTWHAGCNVLEGSKVIMQKFKELPRGERSLPDWEPEVPYQNYVF